MEILAQMLSWEVISRVLDIALVSYLIYTILLFVRGTRALPMMGGLALLLLLYWASVKLSLLSLNWILGNFLGSAILVIVVLFQDDLRRGLTKVGLFPTFGGELNKSSENSMRAVARAAAILASRRIGAIIVIKRDVGLDEYSEHAVAVDALVSHQLLVSIFVSQSPLHDGAVIVNGNRIIAAGAVLPLSFDPKLVGNLGTRHRAAVGLSERTDAICVVVSEERGVVSLVREGKIYPEHDEKSLFNELVFFSALHRRRGKRDNERKLVPRQDKESMSSGDSSLTGDPPLSSLASSTLTSGASGLDEKHDKIETGGGR